MHITMLTATMTHVNNVFNNFTFAQVYFMIPSLSKYYARDKINNRPNLTIPQPFNIIFSW